MSRRNVIDCDRCDKLNIKEVIPVFICLGTSMDASGNGYEEVGEDYDLCTSCAAWLIKKLLKSVNNNDAAALNDAIKREPFPRNTGHSSV